MVFAESENAQLQGNAYTKAGFIGSFLEGEERRGGVCCCWHHVESGRSRPPTRSANVRGVVGSSRWSGCAVWPGRVGHVGVSRTTCLSFLARTFVFSVITIRSNMRVGCVDAVCKGPSHALHFST